MKSTTIDEGIWLFDSGAPGPVLGIAYGVHGNERPPIGAGEALREQLDRRQAPLVRGRLLLVHANPRATAQGRRWSDGGIDLNRCFSAASLAAEPRLWEQERARRIAHALEQVAPRALVDFHCTVEPGAPFLMQHPPADHAPSRDVYRLLAADVLLTDPDLRFGGVSLDEWMSTRGNVGICYETGWMHSPACTADGVLAEMRNLLRGHGMLADGEAATYDDKTLLQLDAVVPCEAPGFHWAAGIGENLQALAGGTMLGSYADGRRVTLPREATLIFPKKRPELVEVGKPLVYLAATR